MGIKSLGRVALVVAVVISTLVAGNQISFAQDPGDQESGCSAGELVSHRTRRTKTLLRQDCTYTTIFGQNLHYEAEPGRWEEVDLRFRPDGDSHVADRNSTVVRVAGARLEITDGRTGQGIIWVLPARPDVSGRRASFAWRGLEWDYAVTDLGVKLEADVADPQGPQTYEFPYQLVRGGDALAVDESGDLRGDGFHIPRAFALGADGETYEAGPWQLGPGRRAAFEFDDSALPQEAFPYVLDPTTSFSPTAAGDEGNVTKSGSSYPPSSCGGWSDSASTIAPERSVNAKGDLFWTTNGFMSWDTSSLPDNATVTTSSLKFYSSAKADSNGRSLTADWYSGWPIDCSDFSDSAQTSAISGIPLANIAVPDTSTIAALSGSTGGVSRTGRTGLRTHISGGQPSGPNFLGIWQLGNASNMPSPQLNVDYSLPGGSARDHFCDRLTRPPRRRSDDDVLGRVVGFGSRRLRQGTDLQDQCRVGRIVFGRGLGDREPLCLLPVERVLHDEHGRRRHQVLLRLRVRPVERLLELFVGSVHGDRSQLCSYQYLDSRLPRSRHGGKLDQLHGRMDRSQRGRHRQSRNLQDRRDRRGVVFGRDMGEWRPVGDVAGERVGNDQFGGRRRQHLLRVRV